jgi:hypothetical protein
LKTTFFSILLLISTQTNAQLASVLEADYLIVSTSSTTQKIESDRGKIILDTQESLLEINSRDSVKRRSISTTERTIEIPEKGVFNLESFQDFNEVQIFRYMLDPKLIDFGMRELDLQSTLINKDEDGIYMEWKASNKYELLFSKVLTKIKGDQLDRIEYFGLDGKLLCEVIFEEWGEEASQKIPLKIKTRYHLQGNSFDRMIKLSQVKMIAS